MTFLNLNALLMNVSIRYLGFCLNVRKQIWCLIGKVSFHGSGRTCLRFSSFKEGVRGSRTKIVTTEKFPPPISMRGVHSFLVYVGFYRRFIKDFHDH